MLVCRFIEVRKRAKPRDTSVKRLFLIGVAALFLATGAAPAEEDPWGPEQVCAKAYLQDSGTTGRKEYDQCLKDSLPKKQEEREWSFSFRTCSITLVNAEITGESGNQLWLDDVLKIQKHIPDLKKCSKFWTCVNDRDTKAKPKHCYYPKDK